ncbi:MAG: hypothetical protein AB1656_10405 [Candidatus Omnitrophota bacterium]
MNTPRFIPILLLALMCCLPQPALGEDVYIDTELLDLKKIREEENLGEKSRIVRLYIFIAVRSGQGFEAYAARGDRDLDKDGKKAIEQPNNLAEYDHFAKIERDLQFDGSEHICFITALPYFETLFKKENLKDPFEKGDVLEIPAKVTEKDKNKLVGIKTLAIMSSTGANLGIERYIAFYNKSTVTENKPVLDKDGKPVKDEAGKDKVEQISKVVISSYGLIEITVVDA